MTWSQSGGLSTSITRYENCGTVIESCVPFTDAAPVVRQEEDQGCRSCSPQCPTDAFARWPSAAVRSHAVVREIDLHELRFLRED